MDPNFTVKKVSFNEPLSTEIKPKASLEKTAEKAITSPVKSTESTDTSKGVHIDTARLLQTAGALSRSGILSSLHIPLTSLQNKKMKLRGGVGEQLTVIKRSWLSIKSRIGGAESKAAVKNLLSQLEEASKQPNDPNNPQSIAKHLNELLDNEWFSKTIAHDKSGELKSKLLDILANEVITNPDADPVEILSKLKTDPSELTSKLFNFSERKEALANLLHSMETEPDLNTLKHLGQLSEKAYFIKMLAEDTRGELKKPVLNILTRVTIEYPSVQAHEINSILNPISSGNLENLVNRFEEGLMDYAYDVATTCNCEKSDNFREAHNNVPTDTGTTVNTAFIEGYHTLLDVITSNMNSNPVETVTRPIVQHSADDAEKLLNRAAHLANAYGLENSKEYQEQYEKVEMQYLAADDAMTESFYEEYNKLTDLIMTKMDARNQSDAAYKKAFDLQYAESHAEAMLGLQVHHYMIEKSGDKVFFHFDLIGSDGERIIRSREVTDPEALADPNLLKAKLDAFLSNIDPSRLPTK